MKYSTFQHPNGSHFNGDIIHVRRALELFIDPAHSYEIRSIYDGGGHPSVCTTIDEGLSAVEDSGSAKAIFWILNPVETGAKSARRATVLSRRWLLIDVDPERPADLSSTDEEKVAACQVAMAIVDYLTSLGWPAPVIDDSGNGWHLLYRIDMPNDPLTHQVIKATLIALAERFDCLTAHVDRACHDAPRPCKLPGTWARKGEDTPDRPHRIARIIFEPETLGLVTVEQLQALIGPIPVGPAPQNGSPKWSKHSGSGSGLANYVQSAIARECLSVALAPEGDRNNALNRAAFVLGTMSAWPEMDEQGGRSTLVRAAERAGLPLVECLRAVASGWGAGRLEPRMKPAALEKEKPVISGSLVIGLDEIVPEKVDWFWENIVAPGFISLFAGRTGMGKSFVVCDYVARLSRGDSPPFSNLRREPMRTLFISEDPPKIMLGPRLLELNAVKSMIKFMRFQAMSIWTLADLEMLEQAWNQSNRPEQIIIDPPSNFLGDIDEHKNAALRGLLMPLVTWLEKNRVACIMITHLNKQTGKGLDAVARIMGSVAWASTARVTMAFDKDPDSPGQHLMGASKNNLGPLAETFAFKIVKTDSLARIEWTGKVDLGADDMVNQIPRKTSGLNAVEWLIGIFKQKREWESEEIRRMARENGISKYALWESPEVLALPITKRKRVNANGEQYWMWVASENWPAPVIGISESSTVSTVTPIAYQGSDAPK